MEIVKVIAIAVIGAISYAYLKSTNSELATLCAIGAGVLLIICSLEYVIITIKFFNDFSTNTRIDSSIIMLVIKITAISYLFDFVSSLCEDVGAKSLSNKVLFISI